MCLTINDVPRSKKNGLVQSCNKILKRGDWGSIKTPYRNTPVSKTGWLFCNRLPKEIYSSKVICQEAVHARYTTISYLYNNKFWTKSYALCIIGYDNYRSMGSLALFIPECCTDIKIRKDTVELLEEIIQDDKISTKRAIIKLNKLNIDKLNYRLEKYLDIDM